METMSLYDGYNQMASVAKAVERLESPLPKEKIIRTEVYDEFVEAIMHKHDWKLMDNSRNPINTKHRLIFQCSTCQDVEVREISDFELMGWGKR